MKTLTDHQAQEQYLAASPAARATIDAVYEALASSTSPERLVKYQAHNDALVLNFEWHDGAAYRVTVNTDGYLLRLLRLQYTGGWTWDEIEGREAPEEVWRTVRAFGRDRAGRVLRQLDRPAATSWTEAAGR